MKDPRTDGVLLVMQSVNNELAELKGLVHNQLLMLQEQAMEIDTLKKKVIELKRKVNEKPTPVSRF